MAPSPPSLVPQIEDPRSTRIRSKIWKRGKNSTNAALKVQEKEPAVQQEPAPKKAKINEKKKSEKCKKNMGDKEPSKQQEAHPHPLLPPSADCRVPPFDNKASRIKNE